MKKIALLAERYYEDLELWYPKIRLEEAGHHCLVIGPKKGGVLTGKYGYPCTADYAFEEAKEEMFDGLIIPGGYAPDHIRRSQSAIAFVAAMDKRKKPVGLICHAGWVAISARILQGKKATSFSAIQIDMENAGAIWEDSPCVIDGHLISARSPKDLPPFMIAFLSKLS